MIKDENKFLAEVYKIAGFALMSPLGRYFLILSDLKVSDISTLFFIHIILSIVLFCFGAIMIQIAYEEVMEKS